MNLLLRCLAMVLGAIAAAGIAALLAIDAKIHMPLAFSASAISAASLLLIGVSFLIVQVIQRPSPSGTPEKRPSGRRLPALGRQFN